MRGISNRKERNRSVKCAPHQYDADTVQRALAALAKRAAAGLVVWSPTRGSRLAMRPSIAGSTVTPISMGGSSKQGRRRGTLTTPGSRDRARRHKTPLPRRSPGTWKKTEADTRKTMAPFSWAVRPLQRQQGGLTEMAGDIFHENLESTDSRTTAEGRSRRPLSESKKASTAA
jgi:hypothetical protein